MTKDKIKQYIETKTEIYVLFCCFWDGDSHLVDDSFVAASESLDKLINLPRKGKLYIMDEYDEQNPPDGRYGSTCFYRIKRIKII